MATGVASDDQLQGILAPSASCPASPDFCFERLHLSLDDCNEELLEYQAASRQLQEVFGGARRQAFVLLAALQRGDVTSAESCLQSLKQLPSPEQVAGERLWSILEVRTRLCESGNVGYFMEGYLTCLQFMSFLESGVITPGMPETCKVGIENQDDERYLLSLVEAVRELERYAVGRGRVLDLSSMRQALSVACCVEQALMQFDFRNSELRRRFDSVKYVVKRLENVVYEVDLAQQRLQVQGGCKDLTALGVVEGTEAEVREVLVGSSMAENTVLPAVDLELISGLKERYTKFDALREQVIKRSRDVAKSSKNAVYALQRSDFKKADALLLQCAAEASALCSEVVSTSPSLRGGGFSAALEEMAEALAYRAFRKEKRLLSRQELQAASGLTFPLSLNEYLGGIMDLTGEVGRLAVRSASRGREAVPDVERCLSCVDGVYRSLQDLAYLPGVGKKMPALKATLLKVEGILYELALLSRAGLRAQAPAMDAEEGAE